MLETYYKYRMEYKDFLLFIKIGNFYEVFDISSIILNSIKIDRIYEELNNRLQDNNTDDRRSSFFW